MRRHLRKVVPGARYIRRNAFLGRVFGKLLFDTDLWHLNRASVAAAVSVGLFMAWVPVPFQMILAAGVAIAIRCNLPVAIALVWISNPVTAAPLFYGAYELGGWLLDVTPVDLQIDISVQWLLDEFTRVWEPFLLGCFVTGLVCAILGHAATRLRLARASDGFVARSPPSSGGVEAGNRFRIRPLRKRWRPGLPGTPDRDPDAARQPPFSRPADERRG